MPPLWHPPPRPCKPTTHIPACCVSLSALCFVGARAERFRVALACILLAEPAPQILVLVEPSNNLDIGSTRHLVGALRAFHGAVLSVSQNEGLLDAAGVATRLEVGAWACASPHAEPGVALAGARNQMVSGGRNVTQRCAWRGERAGV